MSSLKIICGPWIAAAKAMKPQRIENRIVNNIYRRAARRREQRSLHRFFESLLGIMRESADNRLQKDDRNLR